VIADGKPVPGIYAAGWIKRGPTGLIGNNRVCSTETVQCLLEDAAKLRSAGRGGGAEILRRLRETDVQVVTYAGWDLIDAAEREAGNASGRDRRKFVHIADMLELLAESAEGGRP
jgi:ferredoxin--NADP+ reductase